MGVTRVRHETTLLDARWMESWLLAQTTSPSEKEELPPGRIRQTLSRREDTNATRSCLPPRINRNTRFIFISLSGPWGLAFKINRPLPCPGSGPN